MSSSDTFAVLHGFPAPDLECAWREFLGRAALPSHYCAPEFFKEPFWSDKSPFAVLAFHQSNVVGIVTGIHENDEIQCGQPSRPQLCLDSSVAPGNVLGALAQGLLAESARSKLLSIYSWDALDPLSRLGFRSRKLEGDVMLDLKLGPDALFKHFHESRRRNIRLAARNGVEVSEVSTPEDILAFYHVYCEWTRTPRKKIVWENVPFAAFEQAYRLTDNRRAFLAWHSGRAIAGISLRFYPSGLLEYAAGSAIEEFVHLRPNDLLQWRAIQWACSEGFRCYCLGGAHAFLTRFGGEVVPIYRYRLDRTWFRRYDLQESMADWGRGWLKKMPQPVEQRVRRILGNFRRS